MSQAGGLGGGGSGGGVTSVTGTANEVTATPTTGAVVVSTPSTFIAPGSVSATTTLGLVTTTAGGNGVILQNSAPVFNTLGTNNLFLGNGAGNLTFTTGTVANCVGIGHNAMNGLTVGTNNTFIGSLCGQVTAGANNNTAMGEGALANITTNGESNCCFGQACGTLMTACYNNSAYGRLSLSTNVTGISNCAFGAGALQFVLGDDNIGIGQSSGTNYTGNESHNILLANPGILGESNVMRLGNPVNTTATWINGISGVTVTGTAVLCASDGQLGTVASSLRYKEDLKAIPKDVSDALMNLTPVQFTYKKDETKTPQYGLIAEEVDKVLPYLCFYKDGQPESVKYHELPTLLLHLVQKMDKRIQALENQLKVA